MSGPGRVAFVGAGPGDPSLLTVRATELLAAAAAVAPDELTRDVALSRCRPGVMVLDPPTTAQQMARVAGSGGTVVRVVAGDPSLYEGLADEAAACVGAGLRIEVVPGVASHLAAASYAGIPLAGDTGARVLDARELGRAAAGPGGTLVLLSAVDSMPEVVDRLLAEGWDHGTPVAVIQNAGTSRQRTVVADLRRIAETVRDGPVDSAAVTVLGPAVTARDALSWYESRALFGWRVLLPRTTEALDDVAERLRGHGATSAEVDTLVIGPARSPAQVERAAADLVTGCYGWVAFTSPSAVHAIRDRLGRRGLDARAMAGLRVAAVGQRTVAALAEWGIRADLVPSGEQTVRGLLREWPVHDERVDPIDRVLLLRAEIATETLAVGLAELGWQVEHVTAFRVIRAAPPPQRTREAIKGAGFDAVLFTSSSSVRNLIGLAGKPHGRTVVACIGPQTARSAEEHHLRVDVVAPEPTRHALVEALAEYGAARRRAALGTGRVPHLPYLPREHRAPRRRKA